MREFPRKYKALVSKANTSRKACIRLFCLECCGYNESEVRLCSDSGCPLHKWRLKG